MTVLVAIVFGIAGLIGAYMFFINPVVMVVRYRAAKRRNPAWTFWDFDH